VGTGSILLTCALKGGFCYGSDIDIRVIRGRNDDENILANFRQYNLPRPEIVRSDNSLHDRHFRRKIPLKFDAIVCDPPYGIRAGARQSGTKQNEVRAVQEDKRHDHIAQTKPYPVSDVMADLLNVAAEMLEMHGRLVYIIPSMNDFDFDVDLPRHPCLQVVHCCFQPLQMHLGRRVVAMEKIAEYDDSQRDTYKATAWVNGPESAEKVANIRERILEEARKKPGYLEKCSYRAKKRKLRKEECKRQKLASHADNGAQL
jgi:tRNA (guanine10-N2)-methyltransferase